MHETTPFRAPVRAENELRAGYARILTAANIPLCITYSVFRLAARRTGLPEGVPRLESAPVSEKRVGLSRRLRRPAYGR